MPEVNLKELGIVEVVDLKITPENDCDERGEYLGNGQYQCKVYGLVSADFCNKRCAYHYIKRENH